MNSQMWRKFKLNEMELAPNASTHDKRDMVCLMWYLLGLKWPALVRLGVSRNPNLT